ncbi:oligopeptide transporter 1-like [Iris pallida]|uniref:Oligopeptide transporter 1-like n=1 Tax=Iris pallida TaxID=29817 RepID=A0AAX6EBY9_IRIPA|nr:oligopeptide transporter 1-like [Iris pallida]
MDSDEKKAVASVDMTEPKASFDGKMQSEASFDGKFEGKYAEETEEDDNSPIEEVRLTVPTTDDPRLPALTFRTWLLGVVSCVLLAFLNQFFGYRTNALYISSVSAQIAVLPVGRVMAACLPSRRVGVPGTGLSFTLNPGPFNLKEHVLITIFANAGSSGAYAVGIVTIVKAFYHRKINPAAALLLTITTQVLGFGWAGLFRKYLVDSPYMWWPSNLVQVSLFRAMHEEEKRAKGGTTRLQFFIIVFISSFCYYIIPSFFFQAISSISIMCYIWKDSLTMQLVGSGDAGLGIGSFGLDWSTVAGFTGTPLATPGFAMLNILFGYVAMVYLVLPAAYWTNTYGAKRFPLISPQVYSADGRAYDVDAVLDQKSFSFSQDGYDRVGQVNLSVLFVIIYGLSFATLAAALSHVALFHGSTIWRQTKAALRNQIGDVHTRMMKRNYAAVPQWWFHVILVAMLALSILTCEGFGKQLQLPYWGVLLAAAMAFAFTLPIGIITATTNQQPGLNVITELIIGYILPGKPLANVAFKTYGYISMTQAITFLSDFKLGHYMKIPPRSMFIVQLIGTIIAACVTYGTSWWLLESIDHICDPEKLPKGSPWTCPGDNIFYSASIIWGVVAPLRMFGSLGLYSKMNYFFLIGLLSPVPVWFLSRAFPKKRWIKLINMPVILGGAGSLMPAKTVNYNMWFAVGLFFNFVVYRRYKGWWARYNYVLSAALDAGVAFMAVLTYFALQMQDLNGINWWGVDTHCPLAYCPADATPGVEYYNCPIVK